jgi:putative transcriptional regulator
LQEPAFAETVIYLCEHTEDGAVGIIINRPSKVTLKELTNQLEISVEITEKNDKAILLGGPVAQQQGFILFGTDLAKKPESKERTSEITFSSSIDMLTEIAKGKGPEMNIISLGCAGWGAGQVEKELMENSWLLAPPNANIIFKLPFQQRWEAAAASIGVNRAFLSGDIGHA